MSAANNASFTSSNLVLRMIASADFERARLFFFPSLTLLWNPLWEIG